ncbi:hypothetical protein HAX54_011308 [Datura stramonium]|uniref:Uncharacterized protein n=1 Tax=Datura stramonium TaxID=4076 RepID=A0ABS8TJ99_DATST|nr:hypothetical protein [Datura stramonium]
MLYPPPPSPPSQEENDDEPFQILGQGLNLDQIPGFYVQVNRKTIGVLPPLTTGSLIISLKAHKGTEEEDSTK